MSGKTVFTIWFPVLCCAAIFLAFGHGIAETEVTITGMLEPAEMDDHGAVFAVTIYDGEYGTVLVLDEGKGADLVEHVGEEVTLTGTIEELDEESGYLYGIIVSRYILHDAEEDIEQEYEEPDPGDDN
jgi:hypothetical protein